MKFVEVILKIKMAQLLNSIYPYPIKSTLHSSDLTGLTAKVVKLRKVLLLLFQRKSGFY